MEAVRTILDRLTEQLLTADGTLSRFSPRDTSVVLEYIQSFRAFRCGEAGRAARQAPIRWHVPETRHRRPHDDSIMTLEAVGARLDNQAADASRRTLGGEPDGLSPLSYGLRHHVAVILRERGFDGAPSRMRSGRNDRDGAPRRARRQSHAEDGRCRQRIRGREGFASSLPCGII